MMKKVLRMGQLFDSYGQLLTEKQREFMRLYYEEDFSLGEIAEEFKISRQAVHDILRRAEVLLEEWEGKLGLLEGRVRRQRYVDQVLELLAEVEEKVGSDRTILALFGKIRLLLVQIQED